MTLETIPQTADLRAEVERTLYRHVVVFTLAATPSAFTFSMGAGDIDAGTFTLIRTY